MDFSSQVTFIGRGAFADCVSLTTIHFPEALIEIEKSSSYEKGVFEGCTVLKTVYTNSKLPAIPYWTFGECTALEEIYIEKELNKIGAYAFSNCKNIKRIYFNGSIEEWDNIVIEEASFHESCNITVICTNGEIELLTSADQ